MDTWGLCMYLSLIDDSKTKLADLARFSRKPIRTLGFCIALVCTNLAYGREFNLAGKWNLADPSGQVTFEVAGTEVTARIRYDTGMTGEGKGSFDGEELHLNIVWRDLTFSDERVNRRLDGQLLAVWKLAVEDESTLSGKRSINRVRWSEENGELEIEVEEDVRRDTLTLASVPDPVLMFVDQWGQEIENFADFSRPRPIVTLDDIQRSDIRIEGNTGIVTVSGSVRDAIADIVEGSRANIEKVFIEYIDPRNNDGGIMTTTAIEVRAGADAGSTSSLKPFPFTGQFEAEIAFPATSDILITVRAENVAGNSGYDSFNVIVSNGEVEVMGVDGGPPTIVVAYGDTRVNNVENYASTGLGLFNPVRVFLGEAGNDRPAFATFGGNEFEIVEYDGQLQLDRPFIGLAIEGPFSAPNIFDVLANEESNILEYDGDESELSWAYTAHSPPNYYKYVTGMKVTHKILSPLFRGYSLVKAEIESLPSGSTKWIANDYIKVTSSRTVTSGQNTEIHLDLDIGTLGTWFGREKRVVLTLRKKSGTRQVKVNHIGRFEVIPGPRFIIISVDGLAFDAMTSVFDGKGSATTAPNFHDVFHDAVNRDKAALSALPTVTWINWSSIFSGQPPKDHGILGNAFFPRDLSGQRPYNSASDGGSQIPIVFGSGKPKLAMDKQDGLWASLGEFDKLAHQGRDGVGKAGSLYDLILRGSGNENLSACSIHQWYAVNGDNVDMVKAYFPRTVPTKALALLPHDGKTANFLDTTSASAATLVLRARPELDVLTVYFPGPDNWAHAVGENRKAAKKEALLHPDLKFTERNVLPNVDKPLDSIFNFLRLRTDKQFRRIIDAVAEDGYLYATIFALVADHGLHAYKNTKKFNMTLGNGMAALFNSARAGVNVWRGGKENADISERNLVYAPNGGMAQIYLRTPPRRWSQPPIRADIDTIATLLYEEAMGKRNPAVYPDFRGALGNPPAIFVVNFNFI